MVHTLLLPPVSKCYCIKNLCLAHKADLLSLSITALEPNSLACVNIHSAPDKGSRNEQTFFSQEFSVCLHRFMDNSWALSSSPKLSRHLRSSLVAMAQPWVQGRKAIQVLVLVSLGTGRSQEPQCRLNWLSLTGLSLGALTSVGGHTGW